MKKKAPPSRGWRWPHQYDAEHFTAKMRRRGPTGPWIVETFRLDGSLIGHTEAKTRGQAWFMALSLVARVAVETLQDGRDWVGSPGTCVFCRCVTNTKHPGGGFVCMECRIAHG